MSAKAGRMLMPAEFTRMSGSPNGRAAASPAARIPSRVPRSPTTPAARQPASVSSRTVSSIRSAPRATITVAAPARASAVAMPRPMPELPPVTTAVRPSREKSSER